MSLLQRKRKSLCPPYEPITIQTMRPVHIAEPIDRLCLCVRRPLVVIHIPRDLATGNAVADKAHPLLEDIWSADSEKEPGRLVHTPTQQPFFIQIAERV